MHSKSETRLHFVGIGGIGMSGIAEVFLNQGYCVSGSDLASSDITKRLEKLGATLYLGHRRENIQNPHVVVISSAVSSSNPEVQEAKRLRIPVIPRAEMLGELMRGKVGIAIAGSHGKTTTTSMLATILTDAEMDPTLVIGGKVDKLGGHAKLGQGKYVVAEADESDGSFLHLPATFGVVTNVDNDHLDHFKSVEALETAFLDFVGKLPFYGFASVCGDDPGVRRCLHRWTKPFVTYGFSDEWDVNAKDIEDLPLGSEFSVHLREGATQKKEHLGRVRLSVPGRHNILNALSIIPIALRVGTSFETIQKALLGFKGVKRRFDLRINETDYEKPIAVIDDYAHHPTELRATLRAVRNFWKGRIISVFQPHRYSRTLYCWDEFAQAFTLSDLVILTDIYSAGEEKIEGVDSQRLAAHMNGQKDSTYQVHYAGDLEGAHGWVKRMLSPGDLILCLGAGSITRLTEQFSEEMKCLPK